MIWDTDRIYYAFLGIPLGISSAVPILLQNRGVSYSEQAGFTFAYYPYTSEFLLLKKKNQVKSPNINIIFCLSDSENIMGTCCGFGLH